MKSEIESTKNYSLYFDYSFDEEMQELSRGKLLHVLQNICRNYIESFCVTADEVYVFKNGDFQRTCRFTVEFTGGNPETADRIAEDICAFVKLDEITVKISDSKKYIIKESI